MKSTCTLAFAALALLIGLVAAPVSLANDAHHVPASVSASASAEAGAAMSEGEVKKVDKAAGKITIKHGPLANLDMPPMTMVFRVKDAAVLDQVKAGDRIRFVAEKDGGAITVTRLEQVK